MIRFAVLILIGVWMYSCGTSEKMVKQGSNNDIKEETGLYDESFDPLSLDDEDIVITKKDEAETKNTTSNEDEVISEEGDVVLFESEGFRVQIFATRSIETATLAQQKAIDQFSDLEYKVYLIFEAPLYRIRLGDALSRSDAEDIRDHAKERGYEEAFIVRSQVMVPQNTILDETNGF